MPIASIVEWLNGSREYSIGLSIAEQHEGELSATALRFVKTGRNSITEKKLVSLLSALNDTYRPKPVVSTSHSSSHEHLLNEAERPDSTNAYARESDGELPVALREAKALHGTLYSKTKHLKAQLLLFRSDHQRLKAAEQIVNMYDKIIRIRFRLDTYRKQGFDPAAVRPDEEYRQMLKDVMSIPAYLSKYKNDESKAELLDEKRDRLAYIKEFANG